MVPGPGLNGEMPRASRDVGGRASPGAKAPCHFECETTRDGFLYEMGLESEMMVFTVQMGLLVTLQAIV